MISKYIVPNVTKYFISYTGDIEAGLANLGVENRFVRLSDIVGILYTETEVSLRDLLQIPEIDFIYEDGTSKIAYLWDQTIAGNPPQPCKNFG